MRAGAARGALACTSAERCEKRGGARANGAVPMHAETAAADDAPGGAPATPLWYSLVYFYLFLVFPVSFY